MNLKFIKNVGTRQLYVNVDTLEFVTKRTYSSEAVDLIVKLQDLGESVNIPKILHVDYQGSSITTCEQYIEGRTLQALIDNQQFISSDELERYTRELIAILQSLHHNAIIHKDVKPDNIVVSGAGVYLIDFDISRTYKAEQSKDTKLFGTEGYASPEQYGFSQTTTKSDVYSLGKTLLDLLAITIVSVEQYQFYEQLFTKMIALDPDSRLDLEAVLIELNRNTNEGVAFSFKHLLNSIDLSFKESKVLGIVRTRGGIIVSSLVSLFLFVYAYEIVDMNATVSSEFLIWMYTINGYYLGSLAMNFFIIPKFRILFTKFKDKPFLAKAVIWWFLITGELMAFASVVGVITYLFY